MFLKFYPKHPVFPSLTFWQINNDDNNSNNDNRFAELFLVRGRSLQFGYQEIAIFLGSLEPSVCGASVPAGALQCVGYLGLKANAFYRFTLIRFNNFHPKLRQPSSFPSVCFCPRGQDLLQCLPSGSREPSSPRKREGKQQRGWESGVKGES